MSSTGQVQQRTAGVAVECDIEGVQPLHDVARPNLDLTHGSVYGASNCSICGVARCPDWVDAYDKLAVAGKLMGEPQQWEPLLRDPRRYQ
jgi:hypothetical protein